MRKIINAEGQEFVPVSTDDLVLDAVPTVNSFNSVTSDAVARAIAGASGEVPQVTENDNGKVLSAIYDEGGPAVEWAEAPSGVPSYSSTDYGKVLGVVDRGIGGNVEWVVPTASTDGTTIAGNGTVDAPLSVKHDSSLGTASVVSEIIDESNLSWTNNQYIDVTVTEAQANAIRAALNNAEPVYLGMLFSGGPTIKLNRSSGASGKSCYMHIGTPTWSYLFIAVSTNSLGTTNGSGVVSVDLSSLALSSFTYRPEYMLPGTWRIWFSASSRQYTDPIEELSNDLYNVTVDGSTAVTTEFRMVSSENALAVTNPVPAYAAGDAGKVLKVNSGATGVEWATPSGGVVMIDYAETDENLFNAAEAGITNGQPVFVTRYPDQTLAGLTYTFPAFPLTQRRMAVNGNVTNTELCFTCICMQDTAAKLQGFTMMKTATYNPDTGTTTNSFTRTPVSKTL